MCIQYLISNLLTNRIIEISFCYQVHFHHIRACASSSKLVQHSLCTKSERSPTCSSIFLCACLDLAIYMPIVMCSATEQQEWIYTLYAALHYSDWMYVGDRSWDTFSKIFTLRLKTGTANAIPATPVSLALNIILYTGRKGIMYYTKGLPNFLHKSTKSLWLLVISKLLCIRRMCNIWERLWSSTIKIAKYACSSYCVQFTNLGVRIVWTWHK